MIAVAIATLAAGVSLDGSVRSEARAGSTVGGQDPSSVGVTAELDGRASYPEGAVRFALAPSLALGAGHQVFIRGFGEGGLRIGQRASLRLREALGYGTVDLAPVTSGPALVPPRGPVQVPAGTRFVSVQESNTSLELEVPASRRLRFVGSGAWEISGGADATARASLPLSRGPHLRARLDWSATRLDLIRVAVEAFDYRYSNGNRASIASLTAGWGTRPWRGAELSVAMGPGFGRAQIRDEPATVRAYAVGTAEFRSALERDLSAAIGASVEPLGDPVSGDLVERGSLRLSAAWGGPRGISVGARLIGSVALTSATGGTTSPQAGDRFLQGELSATMPLSVRSSVAVGVRGAYLSRPVLDQPADQWVAFVSYAAQVPLQR